MDLSKLDFPFMLAQSLGTGAGAIALGVQALNAGSMFPAVVFFIVAIPATLAPIHFFYTKPREVLVERVSTDPELVVCQNPACGHFENDHDAGFGPCVECYCGGLK